MESSCKLTKSSMFSMAVMRLLYKLKSVNLRKPDSPSIREMLLKDKSVAQDAGVAGYQ